jgi:two-component system chemotaxis response regulator CheY
VNHVASNTAGKASAPEKLIGDLEFLRSLSMMKVLIADDQKNMVKTIENMLTSICSFKRKSDSILRANDGQEALDILLNQPPKLPHHVDLVLLDWNMPNLPGIEVIRAIRTSEFSFVKDVPVIMITGESRLDDVNEALYAGVDNYLLKPFVLDDMRTRMNPIIRQYWSGIRMKRASNRRNEVRYPADALRMKMQVEFLDGTKKTADVINISDSGARLELDKPEKFEVRSVAFANFGETGEFGNRNNCVSFMPKVEGNPKRIQLSVWFKFGFETEGIKARWNQWVEAAREKYVGYRGQQI